MKKFLLIFIFALSFFSSGLSADDTQKIEVLKPYITKFFNHLRNSEYDKVSGMLDSTARKQMTKALMETVKGMMDLQFGDLVKELNFKYSTFMSSEVVEVKYEFQRSIVGLRYVFNKDKMITAFYISSREDKDFYKKPIYVDTTKFTEVKFKFGYPEYLLPAVLSVPKGTGPFPVLILVHGSGPNDMDESIGPNKPFRDLAWGLATKGIAVLRYDKRTKTHGMKILSQLDSFTIYDEVINDVMKAVDTLKSFKSISKKEIFVLGHSLGGMALPRIAARKLEIKGLISMAGPARYLEDLLIDQILYIANLDPEKVVENRALIDSTQAQVERVKSQELTKEMPSKYLPMNINAAYWLDLRAYAPSKYARDLTQPMFIIQGGRDYQVRIIDFDMWKMDLKDRKNIDYKYYQNLNHLFFEGEGMSKPAEYQIEGHVAEYVITDIYEWILKICKQK